MPRLAIATPERVSRAADALCARGARPTIAAVRREIGGGSYSTISPLLEDWRKAQAKVEARPPASESPEILRELWETSCRQAGADFESRCKALEEALEGLRAERAECDATIVKIAQETRTLAADRDAALEREAAAEMRARKAEAKADARAAELKRMQARLGTAEEARGELLKRIREVIDEGVRAALESGEATSAPDGDRMHGGEGCAASAAH